MAKKISDISPEEFESVARLFSVLADPTRLLMLHTLKIEPAYVSELCDRTGLRQANVSKHLSLMYDAGLVKRERHGNQIRYSIGDAMVFDLCNLVCEKLQRAAESQAKLLRRVGA
jgi:DNA-binding transcriptional ArsR family regulator